MNSEKTTDKARLGDAGRDKESASPGASAADGPFNPPDEIRIFHCPTCGDIEVAGSWEDVSCDGPGSLYTHEPTEMVGLVYAVSRWTQEELDAARASAKDLADKIGWNTATREQTAEGHDHDAGPKADKPTSADHPLLTSEGDK